MTKADKYYRELIKTQVSEDLQPITLELLEALTLTRDSSSDDEVDEEGNCISIMLF